MTRERASLAAVLLAISLLGAGPAAGAAATSVPDTLADSTVVEHWTLTNGLRVTTRNVPQARVVAISVAYGIGADDDPPGLDGLAQVLSELQFTSLSGDIPERAQEDLDSQRRLGWSFTAGRRMTLLTEVASMSQFPGVLSQVAARMKGVQVTREGLGRSVANARSVFNEQVYGPPSTSLFYITGQVARGWTTEAIEAHASARNLDRLTVAEAQQHLQKRFVVANAALAIAGDLSGVGDVHRLVQNLFGTVPAGERWMRIAPDPPHPGDRIVQFQRTVSLGWAVGIIAPALADSSHPSFYLNSLLLGSLFNDAWRPANDPHDVGLFYTLFDEPDLVRVIPPVDPKTMSMDVLARKVRESIKDLYREVVTAESYNSMRRQWVWALGGPMADEMLDRARVEAAPMHSLARCMAGREIQGGEEFWAGYRRRFLALQPGGMPAWIAYYVAPEHQVRLMVLPGR